MDTHSRPWCFLFVFILVSVLPHYYVSCYQNQNSVDMGQLASPHVNRSRHFHFKTARSTTVHNLEESNSRSKSTLRSRFIIRSSSSSTQTQYRSDTIDRSNSNHVLQKPASKSINHLHRSNLNPFIVNEEYCISKFCIFIKERMEQKEKVGQSVVIMNTIVLPQYN